MDALPQGLAGVMCYRDNTIVMVPTDKKHLATLDELHGGSTRLLSVLSGVKDNSCITYLHVAGEPLTTCQHGTTLCHVRIL